MLNISKMVKNMMLEFSGGGYEIAHGLSIGIMVF